MVDDFLGLIATVGAVIFVLTVTFSISFNVLPAVASGNQTRIQAACNQTTEQTTQAFSEAVQDEVKIDTLRSLPK